MVRIAVRVEVALPGPSDQNSSDDSSIKMTVLRNPQCFLIEFAPSKLLQQGPFYSTVASQGQG